MSREWKRRDMQSTGASRKGARHDQHTHDDDHDRSAPVDVGTKYIRWGLGLFVFGLVIGYGPWLHYMHGALEEVQPTFLKNVTLWFGFPWTLPTYIAQLGGLSMVVIGLCYLAFARDGAIASLRAGERIGPALCAFGILAEFVFGYPGYFAVNAV